MGSKLFHNIVLTQNLDIFQRFKYFIIRDKFNENNFIIAIRTHFRPPFFSSDKNSCGFCFSHLPQNLFETPQNAILSRDKNFAQRLLFNEQFSIRYDSQIRMNSRSCCAVGNAIEIQTFKRRGKR